MDDTERHQTFMSALVTEHFVLQTAANATVSEAGTRASLYLVSLSSSLVALGFASRSREIRMPFVATILPALFLLGLFTVARLVDAAIAYNAFLRGVARIRQHYRTLTPEAKGFFVAERGRWPETEATPSLRLGPVIGFATTIDSMVAFINGIVAGAGVAPLAGDLPGDAQRGQPWGSASPRQLCSWRHFSPISGGDTAPGEQIPARQPLNRGDLHAAHMPPMMSIIARTVLVPVGAMPCLRIDVFADGLAAQWEMP